MATHSSVLAWRILGTGEPGRLPSMGSHRVGHDWSDLAEHCILRVCATASISLASSLGWLLLFSHSVVSDSLWPQVLQHARHPDPSPTPAQTHVHRVGDAIQPSHPLSSPSPRAFNLSQIQGLFQWVSFLHQVAKVLELQLHHQSFQWISRIYFLSDWLHWSPAVQGTLKSLDDCNGLLSSPCILLFSPVYCVQPTLVFLLRESPWTEEAGSLQSMGSQELDTT